MCVVCSNVFKLCHSSQDPQHCDADPQLVWEDMSVMSDFELHKLCLSVEVSIYGGHLW